MEINVELENLKKEIQQKIGRNVILFQQMEHMLKALVTYGNLSGYTSELQTNFEQRTATIHKQTMGKVVGQFLENSYSDSEETTNEPNELKEMEMWVSSRITIGCDDVFYEERQTALASLVTERNNLIHHLLPKWNQISSDSGTEIKQYLDQQREKILPELQLLNVQIKALEEARKILEHFIASGEFEKCSKLLDLRQSELVACLIEIAKQSARPDGWVVLSNAAHTIRQQVPDEVAHLEERYGHKKLKGIILATDYFDITEEPTHKGGIRVLYRIKPDLNFAD